MSAVDATSGEEQHVSGIDLIGTVLTGQHYQLTYLGSESLPNFELDGMPARIHTQGIYVTDQSLYITGRLERKPKKALFLRFDRDRLELREFLDITPSGKADHDHPGGFDYDGHCFWIPVAVSSPQSSTVFVRVCSKLDKPLSQADVNTAFELDDHIGAIAVDQKRRRLFGANWDTKQVYVWQNDGTLLSRTSREELVTGRPDWALAVQDWKGWPGGLTLAGGFDKSSRRQPNQSRAVIAWLDIHENRLADNIRIPDSFPAGRSQTREGLAVLNDQLFLLPGDLGEDAVIYRYRVESIKK